MTVSDNSTGQGEGPSPRSEEATDHNSNSRVVQPEHSGGEACVAGDDLAGDDEISFPKSLLKRIVKERLMNSGAAAVRNDSFDPSKVQVRALRW